MWSKVTPGQVAHRHTLTPALASVATSALLCLKRRLSKIVRKSLWLDFSPGLIMQHKNKENSTLVCRNLIMC